MTVTSTPWLDDMWNLQIIDWTNYNKERRNKNLKFLVCPKKHLSLTFSLFRVFLTFRPPLCLLFSSYWDKQLVFFYVLVFVIVFAFLSVFCIFLLVCLCLFLSRCFTFQPHLHPLFASYRDEQQPLKTSQSSQDSPQSFPGDLHLPFWNENGFKTLVLWFGSNLIFLTGGRGAGRRRWQWWGKPSSKRKDSPPRPSAWAVLRKPDKLKVELL